MAERLRERDRTSLDPRLGEEELLHFQRQRQGVGQHVADVAERHVPAEQVAELLTRRALGEPRQHGLGELPPHVGQPRQVRRHHVRQKFGFVFQAAALFDSMTVEENVGFVLTRERKLTRAEIDTRIARVLDLVDLSGTQRKKPAELSGGMRKRVGLARAIIYEPAFVLYDEPTTGLDPIVSDSIDKLIIRVQQELKITSVVVTHDMRSARRVGQTISLLHKGRIHVTASPEDLFASSDPIVHRFVNGISDDKQITFTT